MQTPLASYSASCASNSAAYPNPLMCQMHLKICKAHRLRVKESLISKEQQHRAAAGSSSTGQTGGSISSMSFKRQTTLPEGQLHSLEETQALPLRRSSGERGGLHMNGTYVYVCIQISERVCMCICTKCAFVGSMRIRRVFCGLCLADDL